MTQEELRLKVGIENSSIDPGLREMNAKIKAGAANVESTTSELSLKSLKSFQKTLSFMSKLAAGGVFYSMGEKMVEGIVERMGKVGSAMSETLGRLWDSERHRLKGLREEQEKTLKDVKTLSAEVDKLHERQRKESESPEERVRTAEKKVRELMNHKIVGVEGDPAYEKAKLENEKAFLEAKIEKDAALKALADERKKKEEELTKEKEKQEKIEGKIRDNKREQQRLEEELIYKARELAKLQPNQELEQFMPSIEEIAQAGDPLAIRAQFLAARMKKEIPKFGKNDQYVQADVKEYASIKSTLRNEGKLPDNSFEQMKQATRETADALKNVVNEGLKLKDNDK